MLRERNFKVPFYHKPSKVCLVLLVLVQIELKVNPLVTKIKKNLFEQYIDLIEYLFLKSYTIKSFLLQTEEYIIKELSSNITKILQRKIN